MFNKWTGPDQAYIGPMALNGAVFKGGPLPLVLVLKARQVRVGSLLIKPEILLIKHY